MNEQDDEMLKTYREKYPFQEQAKLFYESVLLKKVEISNCKSQIEAVKLNFFFFSVLNVVKVTNPIKNS